MFTVQGGRRRGAVRRGEGGLTDDCVPSGDDAVQDAVEHDAVGEQGRHDLPNQPPERGAFRKTDRKSDCQLSTPPTTPQDSLTENEDGHEGAGRNGHGGGHRRHPELEEEEEDSG